uniref:Phorbol-ester/DAG-type domain-containing protein n=1 Tax=Sipha flava TaxID=143950 RepID=A0A2S2QSD9_9HEMI
MDRQCQHTFVSKPFYKWFRKCDECRKRKLWTPITKCSVCKHYCHRRCIKPDGNVYSRSTDDVGPTALMTNTIERNVENVRDLNLEDSGVIENNSADIDNVVNPELCEHRPYEVKNAGDLGTGIALQDHSLEAIDEGTMPDADQNAKDMKPPGCDVTADENSTNLASNETVNEECIRNPLNREDSRVFENSPESSADGMCAVNIESTEQRPYVENVCALGTEIAVEDRSPGAVDDEPMPNLGREKKYIGHLMTVDESSTENEDAQTNEAMLSSSVEPSGNKWLYFFIF